MRRTITEIATVAGGALLVVAFAAYWAFYAIPSPAIGAERICGTASWYQYGTITRSGEAFHPDGYTAAMVGTKHLGEVYRVHYGHKSVVVRINDTGGFAKYGRIIDLSRGAAAAIGLIGRGVGTVCLERLR